MEMESPRSLADTPFVRLVVRWLKAQTGLLDVADFARITGFGRAVVGKWMYDGINPTVDSLIRVWYGVRRYNVTYPPNYDDPAYPFAEAGIPWADMVSAIGFVWPIADVWGYLSDGLAATPELTDEERARMLHVLVGLRRRYQRGES